MTVDAGNIHARLVDLGVAEDEARQTEAFLARHLPVGRPVTITDEVLDAATNRNAVLITLLLAEEVDPDADDLAALEQARTRNDGTTVSLEELRADLGL